MDRLNKSAGKFGISLDFIVKQTTEIDKVKRCHLKTGDYMYVKTLNSVYVIRKREDNLYEVSGGWFDRRGLSPKVIAIRGCTWGGSIINLGIVAARGLLIEFGNNLLTSPIRKIIVIKSRQLN
jgi:hypothetical protein